ncbi:hypothetical protein V493_06111 [Pseudogymnoascus sp. VKM F-4281 (FW-2241)]|nr:hypothetical protein V493_06111 [Pseudogymnoascus sp. VKM F-4281 (FW-2241)]
MSGYNIRDTVKKNLQSKGTDGKPKESWRGDFKGIDQISGLMGRGKGQTTDSSASQYVARPLSSLKDPSSFGPPPKKNSYSQSSPTTPVGSQSGPSTAYSRQSAQEPEEQEQRASEPYRRDTTGLSTSHLPLPPGRRGEKVDGAPAPKAKPSLPPRLPPRQNENPGHHTPPPPPAYHEAMSEPPAHRGLLNQGSLSRLGAAGVSVPGFDIGPKTTKPALKPPPPIPSRKLTPADQSPSHDAQMNALQSRFSQMGTSSPKEPAAQGTTWAEKQSALKTASSFKDNPSSVSFSDARNAASTFNNLRERHGTQVAPGPKSADAPNSKYGLADKAASHSAPSKQSDTEYDHGPILMEDKTVSSVKKPPPPPPKKKPGLGAPVDNSGGPPPIPLASKPKPSIVPKPSSKIEDFDLDLKGQWFANQPIIFPPASIERVPGSRGYRYSSGWSSNGVRKTCTFNGLVIYSSLAYTKIHITWDSSNPGMTVKSEQKHFPPPIPPSESQLDSYRQQYSENLAHWCELQMGTQVGNGECWTLANNGLIAVASTCTDRGKEPCMASQGYVHGALIYEKIGRKHPEPPGGVLAAGVARGDIIQFWKARLEAKDGRSWKSAGAPDHTAVITRVERSGVMKTVEQNMGGVKIVKEGNYDVDELVEGEVRIFRAASVNWVGPLEASWP